jgi:hypothetical protein
VTAFSLGDQFSKRRTEVIGVVQAAIELFREEMIAAAQETKNETEMAGGSSPALAVSKAIAASLRCLSDLDSNVRPRLALEAMVMAWPKMEPRGL